VTKNRSITSQRRRERQEEHKWEREQDAWNSRVKALLSDLGGLSEHSERAREKACISRRDAENAEKSVNE